MFNQSNFTQQPSPQLANHIDDQATVLIVTRDGKAYGNKSWDDIQSTLKSVVGEREPA